MSFLRHREIYRSDMVSKTIITWGPGAASRWSAPVPSLRTRRKERVLLIVRDEFPVGYSLAGCSPAEPASASPTGSSMRWSMSAGNYLSANGNLSLISVSQPRGSLQVEAFARNHKIPMEWAQKGVRKEDYVRPGLRRMERAGLYGVDFIFQSMEQGPSFRCSMPKFPAQDPNHRILRAQRSRFTPYYFYLRDETLGPMVMRVASFFPFQATYYLNGHSFIEQELNRNKIGFRKNDNAFLAVDDVAALQATADRLTGEVIRERLDYWTLVLGPKFSKRERGAMNLHRFYAVNQIEYCRNFIFQRHFPIHRIFERSCEMGLWRLTANKISEIFGVRVTKKLKGKLNTTLEQIEHGHHIFRAYFKHAFVKQYEKFSTFLRNEICSNNLSDFGLKKGLDHLAAVREKFLAITDRFATFQAQSLNVHVEFPLLQRLALPITVGPRSSPASRSTTRARSGSWRSCCMAALRSAGGLPARSTPPS